MSGFIGNRPVPPAVQLLGFDLVHADAERGEAEVTFVGRAEFANLMNHVQGGYVCAMLDAAASSALLAQLADEFVAPTVEMKTSFFRPVPLGTVTGRGRVIHRGATMAFLEASLFDTADVLLATATATARIRKLSRYRA